MSSAGEKRNQANRTHGKRTAPRIANVSLQARIAYSDTGSRPSGSKQQCLNEQDPPSWNDGGDPTVISDSCLQGSVDGRVPSAAPAEEAIDHPVTMRLQRFLARAGAASRRGSENLMTAGRVRVNGQVATELGTKVDPLRDEVTLDGMPVRLPDGPVYLMLNKPAGYLTTMSDPQGRPCVASLVPRDRYPGLFPVGRLDMDTTGLLLFTTDGTLAQNLLHPSKHVDKRYVAQVDGVLRDADLEPLRRGMELDDGPCQPARARVLRAADARAVCPGGIPAGTSCAEVVIHEGRKNQVKRMLGKIGHPVLRLHRTSFGPLELTGVSRGSWRLLSAEEQRKLTNACR